MAHDQYTMQDPTTQYKIPEIPKQTQEEPGLDAELTPQADHGEKTYRGSERLRGRKALITGADSGIGRATAIAYAREGADLILSYHPDEQKDMDTLIKTLSNESVRVETHAGDLREQSYVEELAAFAVKAFGSIDILVNNAGKQVYVEDIEKLSTKQLHDTFSTNVFAMFILTKALLPSMPKGASIINTTSIQAYQPSPGLIDYAATKAAIANFSHGLAQQLGPKGIRVNGVAPGPIWTPLQPSRGQDPDSLPEFGKNTPLGRPGQPAEVAPAFVFLASQESSYITGEIIGVTGGQHLP